MEILSPLTYSNDVKLVSEIDSSKIINKYKERLGIDVDRFFKITDKIFVYECIKSGYKFYSPSNVSGDSEFYERLENFNWYYNPWKWEHQCAWDSIEYNQSVLEIGCAKGDFLDKLRKEKKCNVKGIELNRSAKQECEKKSLDVSDLLIEDYCKQNQEKFDVVCSFQVLEHIYDVRSFIESSIKCLKKGGILIISVPNNDSFIKLPFNYLNMPPHHMGIWTKKALRKIEDLFPVQHLKTTYEKSDLYHYPYFKKVMGEYFRKRFSLHPAIIKYLIPIIFKLSPVSFTGFTIQSVYKKF